jgi:fructose-1,6-bisphosphatase/inositol monophosphatase family enzyme
MSIATSDSPPEWATRLEQLGIAVQQHLLSTGKGDGDAAVPVAIEGGDMIFALDRSVEAVIVSEIDKWPEACHPLVLIAEGFGASGRRLFGASMQPPRFRLLIDPIDGTRSLMYDKRAAWFLAAVAHDRGEATSMSDVFAATMVELPISKQAWCDSFTAIAGRSTIGIRRSLNGTESRPLAIRPSQACGLELGFSQVADFFPGTKLLAAELMERIAAETTSDIFPGQVVIFNDQYLSTGGQLTELMMGHDRCCCDLRAIFHGMAHSQRLTRAHACHPYDLAGVLCARQAGVVITDGFGRELDCPLDIVTDVHWCGYANRAIAERVGPVIAAWLQEHGIGAPQ